jgi:hypothetical protein
MTISTISKRSSATPLHENMDNHSSAYSHCYLLDIYLGSQPAFDGSLVIGLTLRLITPSLSTKVPMVVQITIWLFLCSVWIKTRNSIRWTTCYCPVQLLSRGILLEVCNKLFGLQKSANIDKLLTQNASSVKCTWREGNLAQLDESTSS